MIEINSLDHNGNGIGKLNNKIVFVKNALPGEIVDIRILKEKKNYIEAEINKIIIKSEDRIDSSCPYFDKCGGCDLLHIDYEKQLEFKQNKIENIVNKYLTNKIKINKIVPCDNNFFYRNKTTFQVKQCIGFFKENTYDIIETNKCLISSKLINDSIKHLKQLDLKYIDKITCRSSINELMIILETNKTDINIEAIKKIATSIYIKNNNKYILVFGKKYIIEKLDTYNFLVSPDSFFQININTCFKLYSKIKEYVKTNKNILDLYCGTGSIGIFVSQQNNVLGIEINEYAIKDAIENAKLNNIKNIKFICGESGKTSNNIDFKPDLIIVDPPRAGLSKEAINNIFKLNPKELIYVSCNPMTLMRDLNLLNTHFEIIELTPYDMFPNTKHVETIVYLKRI